MQKLGAGWRAPIGVPVWRALSWGALGFACACGASSSKGGGGVDGGNASGPDGSSESSSSGVSSSGGPPSSSGGSSSGGSSSGGSSISDGGSTALFDGNLGSSDGALPAATCSLPLPLSSTSTPTTVVGTGDGGSCTESALAAAIHAGGIVTFDCGGPATIAVTSTIAVPTTVDTVIDGGGTVTLDGGGTTRILSFQSGDYRGMYGGPQHTLTVQRITLQNAKATGTATFPSASPPCSQGYEDGAGGAIWMVSGTLHVIDTKFYDNTAAATGPDVAGGAIYTEGSSDTTIEGCEFMSNSASNGGAVGSLNSDLTLVNDTFTGNQALGQGGNSTNSTCPEVDGGQRETGSGGNGGAVSIDGGDDGTLTVCGCTFSGNSGHALGGAIFRTPDGAKQTSNIDRTTFDSNSCSGTYDGMATGGSGAMYFHNSTVVLTNSTVSNNTAPGSAGFFGDGTTLEATNTTFAGNVATTGVGGAIAATGTLTNCTFANNQAMGTNYAAFAAALFGGPWTINNTIFDNNTDNDNSNNSACSPGSSANSGAHDLQWPMGGTATACVPGITFADPMLGTLGLHGAGTTATLVPAAAASVTKVGTNCPTTDQTGATRASPCTVGAVEVP